MKKEHERKARRIATLLAGYMRDTLTSAEHDELDEWVGASDKNMRLFEELTDKSRVALALELLNDRNCTTLELSELTGPNHEKYNWGKPLRWWRKPIVIKTALLCILTSMYSFRQFDTFILGILFWFTIERIIQKRKPALKP